MMMLARADIWTIAREPGVLTGKQLEILELKEIHGMSIYSIALAKRLSVSTVRTHLRAAEHNLFEHLERLEQKEPA